jgi:hypothetical protein
MKFLNILFVTLSEIGLNMMRQTWKFFFEELKDLTLSNSKGNYFITSNIFDTQKIQLEPCVFIHTDNDDDETKLGLFKIKYEKYKLKFKYIPGFNETELYKIGRATSAACPYFKYVEIKDKKFIDGGFTHNNPSKLVYQYILEKKRIQPKNIYFISLGCNSDKSAYRIEGYIVDCFKFVFPWISYKKLAGNFADFAIKMNNDYVNEFMVREIGNKYFRISPESFKKPIQLDGISKFEIWTLQEAAREMIKGSKNKIESFCTSHELSEELSKRYNIINKFETRYDLYTGIYAELIAIVDEINFYEKNQNEKEIAKKNKQIKLLEKGIKDFTFIHDGINIKNNKIYTPFKSGDQICYSCKSLAIGYLPAFEKLKPENYFNDKQWGKTIHNCFKNWTQYHFVAANNEIASFIYLLKDRLFQVEITETLDSIISYQVERKELKNFIKFEMKFLSDILSERRTNENNHLKNFFNYIVQVSLNYILYYFRQEDEKKSAIELSEMYHFHNNIFIKFIKTVIEDLENL